MRALKRSPQGMQWCQAKPDLDTGSARKRSERQYGQRTFLEPVGIATPV
jgi:hypothetical protein